MTGSSQLRQGEIAPGWKGQQGALLNPSPVIPPALLSLNLMGLFIPVSVYLNINVKPHEAL